jgi:hypothetical protein
MEADDHQASQPAVRTTAVWRASSSVGHVIDDVIEVSATRLVPRMDAGIVPPP